MPDRQADPEKGALGPGEGQLNPPNLVSLPSPQPAVDLPQVHGSDLYVEGVSVRKAKKPMPPIPSPSFSTPLLDVQPLKVRCPSATSERAPGPPRTALPQHWTLRDRKVLASSLPEPLHWLPLELSGRPARSPSGGEIQLPRVTSARGPHSRSSGPSDPQKPAWRTCTHRPLFFQAEQKRGRGASVPWVPAPGVLREPGLRGQSRWGAGLSSEQGVGLPGPSQDVGRVRFCHICFRSRPSTWVPSTRRLLGCGASGGG